MASSTLPASRFHAVSVCAVSLSSALLGATPGESKHVALLQTFLGNGYAIVSSVLTFKELLDDDELESHLRFFIVVLLALTVLSSALALVSFVFKDSVDRAVILGGLAGPGFALFFGLGALCFAFFQGCTSESSDFGRSEYCEHTDKVVVLVLALAIAVTLLLASLIFSMLDKYGNSSTGALPALCFKSSDSTNAYSQPTPAAYVDPYGNHYNHPYANPCMAQPVRRRYLMEAINVDDDVPPHSVASAMVTRLSALVKACLLGVYWFLVDASLSHDAFNLEDYDVTSWVYGQYAKHGAAIANNILNLLPC